MGFIFIGLAAILFFVALKGKLSGLGLSSLGIGGAGVDGEETTSLNDINKAAIYKYGLDRNFVRAIIKVESNGNTRAFNPRGPSYGLMQITPILAQDYGLIKDAKNVTQNDIALMMDVGNNSEIGCWFIRYLIHKYPKNTAIQMYNLGETGYNSGKRAESYLQKVLYWDGVYHLPWGSAERADRKLHIY